METDLTFTLHENGIMTPKQARDLREFSRAAETPPIRQREGAQKTTFTAAWERLTAWMRPKPWDGSYVVCGTCNEVFTDARTVEAHMKGHRK